MATDTAPKSSSASSVNIYNPSFGWTSPAAVSYKSLIEMLESQLTMMNNNAAYQISLTQADPSTGKSMMQEQIEGSCDQIEEAGKSGAEATRQDMNREISQTINTAAVGGISIGGSMGSLHSAQYKKADAQVTNSTQMKEQLQNMNTPGGTQGTGDLPPNVEITQKDALSSLKAHDSRDGGDLETPVAGSGAKTTGGGSKDLTVKQLLKASGQGAVDEKLAQTNRESDMALQTRNSAQNSHNTVIQGVTSMTQMVDHATGAAFNAAKAADQAEQAEHDAASKMEEFGLNTYRSMWDMANSGNQGAASTAGETIQTLVRLMQAG